MDKAKPFSISKHVVWEAYKRVKANKGSAGVDGVTIEKFERRLKDNLYKLWNRMSSGTYYPPPVRTVTIPKGNGKTRRLGIPTVADRVGQMVVKMYLETEVEPKFHKDSYGYRPKRSAIEAVGTARRRCWEYDWVIDLDIKGFFDNLDHELTLKAVRYHTGNKWILLYVERWLKAPVQLEEGTLVRKDIGSPQGSVISPLLANIVLHHGFDEWMKRKYPDHPFERYCDDIIVHCKSEKEAHEIKQATQERLAQCKLELNLDKTKIIYCKDGKRKGSYSNEKFDFLGYTFRPRKSKNYRGELFISFSPAVSDKALKSMRSVIKQWGWHRQSDKTMEDLSRIYNSKIRGWILYYGHYYKSALYWLADDLNKRLVKWAMRKYKKLRDRPGRAWLWLRSIAKRNARWFAHWQLGYQHTA